MGARGGQVNDLLAVVAGFTAEMRAAVAVAYLNAEPVSWSSAHSHVADLVAADKSLKAQVMQGTAAAAVVTGGAGWTDRAAGAVGDMVTAVICSDRLELPAYLVLTQACREGLGPNFDSITTDRSEQ